MDLSAASDANTLQEIDENKGPNMTALACAYRDVVSQLNPRMEQDQRNYDTRHCIWPGQSDDQRKNAVKPGDRTPFPWKGASDLKAYVVEEIITHGVALDLLALAKANIRAVAVEGGDLGKAAIVSNFMRWLVLAQMTELDDQAEILANYRRERGLGVLGVTWVKQIQKTLQKISLAEIADTAPDVATAIEQNLFPDEIAVILREFFPEISAKKAKAMYKELAETGETTVPFVVATVNRPVIQAYAVGEDLFLPPNTTDLQKAREMYRKVLLSPEQAREKVLTEDWDKEYVDLAIESVRGMTDGAGDFNRTGNYNRFSDDRTGITGNEIARGLVEFVYAYQRLSDEDGVPGIYCTVFCPTLHADGGAGKESAEGYAKHELLGYRHGMYPFVEFPMEKLSRLLLDSRGKPELLQGNQDAIKTELDARRDNASLSTCPPVTHPVGREPGRIGPGAFVGERRPGEFGYMSIPAAPQASVEVQERIENMTRRQVGRPTADDTSGEWQVKQQKEIHTWLRGWSKVMTMCWELYQQYGPDEEFFRVIGAGTQSAQRFQKSEMSGKYDFYITFDVLSTDPEIWQTKLKALAEVLSAFDRNGQGDYSRILQRAVESIDPIWAEEFVTPSDVAAKKEVTETQGDISRMTAGVDLDVPQQGVNPQLRLDTIKNWMTGAPDNPAVDVQASLVSNEALRNRIERYVDQLKFMLDQRENATIGRIGTKPAGNQGVQV